MISWAIALEWRSQTGRACTSFASPLFHDTYWFGVYGLGFGGGFGAASFEKKRSSTSALDLFSYDATTVWYLARL
ncbi:MAG: hypothetical protein ACXVEF_15380 [Polyangiales bacterium]